MKIQLSKEEVYEIKIPEIVKTPEEFYEILEKLEKIAKIFRINMVAIQNTGTTFNKFKQDFQDREKIIANKKYGFNKPRKKSYFTKYHPNPLTNTREKILDLLQYSYHGTREDRKRIEKLLKMPYEEINKKFFYWKNKHNIQPKEIGFRIFGTKDNPKGIREPNYVIKSYTGVFDENGKG